ncbi:hypothetical protein EJ110_NYTH42199 [Nymphaea thermarum]|nr:hypothetical protein EJ110_NYTH42199 [Nymphaea thermarum]
MVMRLMDRMKHCVLRTLKQKECLLMMNSMQLLSYRFLVAPGFMQLSIVVTAARPWTCLSFVGWIGMDGTDGRTIIPNQVSGKEQMVVRSFQLVADHQNSADTSTNLHLIWIQALAEVTIAGAMTFSFIQAIERGAGATYGSLLNAIHNADTEIDGAPLTTLLIMLH